MRARWLLVLAMGMSLVGANGLGGSASGADAVQLSVDMAAERHAINPDIYGMNFVEPELARELRIPVDRWGGNSVSRYNWKADLTNRANDYYFTNTSFGRLREVKLTDVVKRDKALGTKSIITLPMIGYVTDAAKDGKCGFSVAKYGPQTDKQADCGNGRKSETVMVTGNDPRDTSIVAGPDFVAEEVTHFVQTYGATGSGGIAFYSLDNEPGLWSDTHRDVHPKPTTYDELGQKSIATAAAVKKADPTAVVLGPADWGFLGIINSEADVVAGNLNDKKAHGGLDLAAWYLDQFRDYEKKNGTRLLDYLDEHYYPQNNEGIGLSSAGDDAKQRLRLETTRALWDPSYLDKSYIGRDMGEKINLIPRLKKYVADHYPGTKVALTEYNFGGLESVNGALTQADVLGIFGQQGLDLATIWDAPGQSDPGANGFRVYRSYDGRGSTFGETSVQAMSSDRARVSIYAAERARDGAVTIIAINKTAAAVEAGLTVVGGPSVSKADVWRYSAADVLHVLPAGTLPVNGHALSTELPADSITVMVLGGDPAPAGGDGTTATGDAASGSPVVTAPAERDEVGEPNDVMLGAGGALGVVGLLLLVLPPWRRKLKVAAGAALLAGGLGVAGGAFLMAEDTPPPTAGPSVTEPAPDVAAPAVGASSIQVDDPQPGATFKGGGLVKGTAKLAEGEQLFLLVFAPGANQYYAVAADEPAKVGSDGHFEVAYNVQGEAGDEFTMVAISLPKAASAAYLESDRSEIPNLPPGATAQVRVPFKLA